MTDSDGATEILEAILPLPPRERAAALAHWVYMQAAKRMNWPTRVAVAWEHLDEQAKEINMTTMDVWAERGELVEVWLAAIAAHRRGDRLG
jgi:hypothetical protein